MDTLARLRVHEQEFSRRLEEARRAAETRVFEAREAAARVEALAEADCRQELARLRIEQARRLGAELDGLREETTQQILRLGRRAAANRERVLARLLAVVTGSGTP
jgi:vacuolar-type H+-ATPase subunit H